MESARSSVADTIARALAARGIDRVFGLCGGHVMPLWMAIDAHGIAIVDVRDERAAVHMAHAYGELTGRAGVALVTAGPGLTNAITGIANAHVARAGVLVLSGVPPRAQEHRGALQDLPHVELVRAITRYARVVREPSIALAELDLALACARGDGGEPGPAYLAFPTDTLREGLTPSLRLDEHLHGKARARPLPDPDAVERAVELLWSAKRPLVVSGRGARNAGEALVRFLDALRPAYLDTGESRGLVPDSHASVVSAMRGKVLGDADVVLTIGRRLDYQLAYGSPAVFGNARFVRIADVPAEAGDNRRGEVEIVADCEAALDAIVASAGGRAPRKDPGWLETLREAHVQRSETLREAMRTAPDDAAGRMHPNRLLAELRDALPADAIVVADGGDFLSFARVGLPAATWLDPGSLGCIGVGVPFGIAASLAHPGRVTVVATGDGAFGFNAIELDTAVRHDARALFVVANNGAWQIEVHDQRQGYGKVVGTPLRFSDYAAMAKGLGLHAERVERAQDLRAAIARALQRRPALLDVIVSPDAVSSDAKSGLARVPDLQAITAWVDAERALRRADPDR